MTPLTPKAHERLPPLTPAQRVLIEDARSRIATPQTWCQAHLATYENLDGWQEIAPNHPSAERWCGLGTLLCTLNQPDTLATPLTQLLVTRLLAVTARLLDDDRIPFMAVNDDQLSTAQLPPEWVPLTPHQRVLAIYDEVLRDG